MVALSDLPDETLDLVLQFVTEPLREHRENCHTFHRIAAWYSLASVDCRWRKLMEKYPISIELVCCERSRMDIEEMDAWGFVKNIERLRQLARSRVPVLSLTILQDIEDSGEESDEGSMFLPLQSLCYEVSQLLAAPSFQRYSGPILETLSLEPQEYYCFDFVAPPEAYPALKTLHGVGGPLRAGLPPGLETLGYTAGPVSEAPGDGHTQLYVGFSRGRLDCAAEAISRLQSLKKLTVQCSIRSFVILPFSFISQLPASVQVAYFNSFRLENGFGSRSDKQWQAAAPRHLKITEWFEHPDDAVKRAAHDSACGLHTALGGSCGR